MQGIFVFDVITTLPFAKLRVDNKAWRFAFVRIVNIIDLLLTPMELKYLAKANVMLLNTIRNVLTLKAIGISNEDSQSDLDALTT